MSNQHHFTNNKSDSGSLHEKIILLLDAYSTDELEDDEQEVVEQHLASCRECQQQLAMVRQFRGLFTKLTVNEYQQDRNGESTPMPNDTRPSQLVNRVLDEITAKKEERMRQQPIAEIPQNHLPTKNTFRTRNLRTSISIIAAVLCVALFAGSLLVALMYFHQDKGSMSVPPSLDWQTQQGQFIAQNADGIFSIKYMEITNREFRFFYAFRSFNSRIPRVEVFSYFSSKEVPPIRLLTTVQSLGNLDTFNVGVVHASRLNRVGQIIVLQITTSSGGPATWRLSPLKQLLNNPSASWGFPMQQTKLSSIYWYGPVMMAQVAFFKSTLSNKLQSHTPYIFVRIDDPVVVKVITQKEYLAIAGQRNFP